MDGFTLESNEPSDETHILSDVTVEAIDEAATSSASPTPISLHPGLTLVTTPTMANASAVLDGGNIQYHLKQENTENGIAYRVVQLAPDMNVTDNGAGTATFITSSQTLLASPFSNGTTTANTGGTDGNIYVMMQPEVLQATSPVSASSRSLAPHPRTIQFNSAKDVLQATSVGATVVSTPVARSGRDERRKATHNEVERRRRDKINTWIMKLGKIIPDAGSPPENSKSQQTYSKGGILAKACDYIQELRASCSRVPELLKENERLKLEVEMLRQKLEESHAENQVMQLHLRQAGIVTRGEDGAPTDTGIAIDQQQVAC